MSFDPYYKWLGIPPNEQPPNHYRLLGLSDFEQNRDAIDNAADRQMAHVRTLQAGPQGADSQRLLNEIATARLVLLDAARRRAYDESLQSQLQSQLAQTPMVVEVPVSAPQAAPLPVFPAVSVAPPVQVQPRESPATTRRPPTDLTVEILKIVGGGIAGVVLATVLLRLAFGIDMTGMFPVEQPQTPPVIMKKPKPLEKQKLIPEEAVKRSGEPMGTAVDPAPEEMEPYDEPTPSGTVKKIRKKGKIKSSSPGVEQVVSGSPPAPPDPPVPEPSSDTPASNVSPATTAPFRVVSATLMSRRLPGPSDAERQAAEQQLEAAYQLSKLKEDAERHKLATEHFGVGSNRKTPPAERWVTLQAAADLAADTGDARLVARAMDALAQTFEPDVLATEATLLAKAARGARTVDQLQALVETSRVTIQVALANHEYILARDLAAAVRAASDRPAGQPFRRFIYDGQREIVRQQEAWYAYQASLTKLATSSDDADANLAVAKWWILERGDFDAALPYLAKAGKPQVKTAADLDQAKGSDWLPIANAWYDAGMAEPVTPLWLVRASQWYSSIDKSQISGLDGAHVDRRLVELSKNEQLPPVLAQISLGRGAARLLPRLPPVVRRHCVLAMPLERSDHFHNGKSFMICDRSGQANHGALHGVKPATGKAGMALEFAGPEHFIECPDQPSLNPTNAFTISAWLWQQSAVHPQRIDDVLSKEEWGGGTGRGYSLRLEEGRPAVNFGNGPDWLWIHAPQSAGLQVWFHLAAVYDGENLVLLVNGAETGVNPTSKTISVSPQPLRIGRGPFDEARRFHGLIDEVAVFDMALTAADLQAIIDLGRAGKSLAE